MNNCYKVFLGVSLLLPGLALATTAPGIRDEPPYAELHPSPQYVYSQPTTLGVASPTWCNWGNHFFCGYTFNGYIDGSYNYLVRENKFVSGVDDRVFDIEGNGFTLQQFAVTLAYQPDEGFGWLANVIIGRDANITAAYGYDPYLGTQTLALDPLQLYAQYVWGRWTVIAGKFISPTDYEDFDYTQDTNFSRSILFGYAGPGTLLGGRLTYDAGDNLDLFVGINDGWDTIRDFSRDPTFELGANYTYSPRFNVYATGYTGQERAEEFTASGPIGRRNMINVVGIFQWTPRLALVGNYYWANQTTATVTDSEGFTSYGDAVWTGFGAYVNYNINDWWRLSVRGEIFDDRDGFRTGLPQVWKEATLTLGFLPIKCFELRGEVRHDWSNTTAFADSAGDGSNRNNQSYALEALYKFGNNNTSAL